MGLWTEEQIEAWVSPETRMIEMPDGSIEAVAFSALTWSYYDDLLDLGYTHAWLLQIARLDGWEPEPAPFELRFSSAIAYARQVHRERWGT